MLLGTLSAEGLELKLISDSKSIDIAAALRCVLVFNVMFRVFVVFTCGEARRSIDGTFSILGLFVDIT